MKTIAEAAMAEIEAGTAVVTGAVEILCTPPVRVWGGYGILQIDGQPFEGLGDRGVAQVSGASLGGTEQSVELSLSGIEPEALELLDASEVKGAPTTVYRLIFKGDAKTLLDGHVFSRGRLDALPLEDVIGGAATIKAMIEGAARGLGRRGGRMRTDADQRLVKADDGFFRNVSFAGEKTLYWGGKKPATAGTALGGVPATGTDLARAGLNRFVQSLGGGRGT